MIDIWDWVVSTPKLNIEIRRVSAALQRYESELSEMEDSFYAGPRICCPGCMYGKRWRDLQNKIIRVKAQLKRLKQKKNVIPK